jgi:aspartate/methionine/tyrosine aminotransferase
MSLLDHLSPQSRHAPESGIVEVVNYARGRDGLIPLWVGEGDSPTPHFIAKACSDALMAGETFYTWQRGIPELRRALSDYYDRHFAKRLPPEHFYVTGSGMQALKLSIEAVVKPGDEMILLTPAWPNFAAALEISGGKAVSLPLTFAGGSWHLDMDRLADAITPRTVGLFVNSPSNPTGWTASHADLRAIMGLARKHGLWVIADEIYAQYHFTGSRAPSFLDVMEEGDRILFVNSFSKNWSMTGWRVGWIVAPPEMGQILENLIQYSTSGVAQFLQRGGVAALDHGDQFLAANIAKARRSRDILCDALVATNRVETRTPEASLYAFVKIDGVTDSRKTAIDIVDKAGVGLAPGTAFGPGGELFLRACFLREAAVIEEAAARLARYIASM